MTDVRESIAKLTPHGPTLDMAGGRSTADASELLRGLDYAHLLALIGPRPAAMLMAKYLDDKQEERKVRVWWRADVGRYQARSWMLDSLARETMNEHMGRDLRCNTCNGTKERVINNLPVICPDCQGAGFVPYSPDRYRAAIGCAPIEWDRVWRERVSWARRALHIWEADATDALARRRGDY
jgi:hypothetical protein